MATRPVARAKKKSKKKNEPTDPLLKLCRSLPGTTEDIKWGQDLVFSVGGKMFAAFQLPEREPMGVKVPPAAFDLLVGQDGIVPAPYAARFHWVSVTDRNRIPLSTLKDLLKESHRIVADCLPMKTRKKLGLE